MSDSESDITNYAYVWYKRVPENLLDFTDGELDKIYEILMTYSYPCYLTGSDTITQMPTDEKTMLLQHESLFIQKKMADAGLASVIMLQIPRILYDLFNLFNLYLRNQNQNKNEYNFNYDCNCLKMKMSDYNDLTRKYTDSVKKNIFELNAFIVDYVQQRYSMSNIKQFYHEISQEILSHCWDSPVIIRRQKYVDDWNPLDEKEKEKVKEERKNVIRQTIDFEKQHSQGRAILYRGANIVMDSLIHGVSGASRSFNSSILSGCVNDLSACTLYRVVSSFNGLIPNTTKYNDYIICSIKKFIVHDSSNEASLFFIPPIHPFVQLYCRGELFHPRTKFGSDFNKYYTSQGKLVGLICTLEFVEQCDYLISDKTFKTLNELYKRFKMTTKSTSTMDTFDRFPHRIKFTDVLKDLPEQIQNVRNMSFLKSGNDTQSVIGDKIISIPSSSMQLARNAVVESRNTTFLKSGNTAQSVIGPSTISVKGGRRTRHKKRNGNKKHSRSKRRSRSRRH